MKKKRDHFLTVLFILILFAGLSLLLYPSISNYWNSFHSTQAIANYTNFERRGFVIRGMFDINPKLIGLVIRGIEIRSVDDLETFIRENNIQIAALTIPKTKAPEIADRLIKAGIKAIWNFAHTDLVVPDDVVVENVHLSESLMRLSYRVCNMQEKSDAEDTKKE